MIPEVILSLVAVIIIFYYYFIRPLDYWRKRGVPQLKWSFEMTFSQVLRLKSGAEVVEYMYKTVPGERYGGTYQFTRPVLVIKDPDLIKQITIKDFDHFVDHIDLFGNADPLLKKNLVVLKGQEWRNTRSIVSPTFTSSKMKFMFVLMSRCGQNFVNFFINKDERIIELEMKDTFTRYSNDVIASTAFGIEVDSLENPSNEFYVMGKEATDVSGFWKHIMFFMLIMAPKLSTILGIRLFSKKVRNFFINLVKETIRVREENSVVRPDLIHLLIEANKTISRKTVEDDKVLDELTVLDMTSQAMSFFLGGFDATSSLMCFMAYELAINPDTQSKLREEIIKFINECDGILTYEAMMRIKYLDMVISETQRKWTLGVNIDRSCTKPYTIESVLPGETSLELEKGISVFIPIYAIHRDPQYFPDPERFIPDRFSEENVENIKPYTYLPFGLGPRSCVGNRYALLKCKTVFCYLLKNFELVPTKKTQIPFKQRKSFNLASENGFWMGLKRL